MSYSNQNRNPSETDTLRTFLILSVKDRLWALFKNQSLCNNSNTNKGDVHTKIDPSWIDLRSISVRFEKCSHSFRSILDRSQFAFERSHSDRFGLRSISDRSNSLV